MAIKTLVHMLILGAGLSLFETVAATEITVYRNASCGCCGKWVDHMRAARFEVTAKDVDDLSAIKQRYGVPSQFASCHTAVAGSYIVEGHVPAADVARLLAETPAVAGIAAPGMPVGSPGMEGPKRQPYQIVTFSRNGDSTPFAQH